MDSPLNRSQSLASGLEKTSPSWKPPHSHSSSTLSSPHSRQVRGHNLDRSEDGGALIPNVSPPQLIKDWEVIDDLQAEMHAGGESPQDLTAPGICEGYLLKRRKWPLKGWHKRYFVLEAGILRYSKNQHDVLRGRVQGSLDVSHAVMAINRKSYRIDLDAGDILYHIKVKVCPLISQQFPSGENVCLPQAKSHELFYIWVTKLQAHRLYRRKEAAHVQSGLLTALAHCAAGGLAHRNGDLSSAGLGDLTVAPGVPPSASTAVNKKVSAWLQQSHQPDACAQELNRCHLDLSELNRLIKSLQTLELGQAFTNGDLKRIISIQNLSLEKPKKSKSGKIWGHSRTLSRVEALGMLSSSHLGHSHLGASVPSIPDYVYSQLSLPTATLSSESKKIQQDICTVSLRGQRNGKAGNSNSKRMSTIPFSLLNSARFPEVCARNAVPGEAEAAGSLGGQPQPPVGRGQPRSPPATGNLWLTFPPGNPLLMACVPSLFSLQLIRPRGLHLWRTQLRSISTPATISCAVAPPKCPTNRDSAMEAPPTRSRRRGTFQSPASTALAFPKVPTVLLPRAQADGQRCRPPVLTTAT
ncbi:unnamed protein product [Tetraodon nigroviridis]|uniref:(spotted green pufferfish) hypothetical protein n=1 Tax=Tetraodon nigroviridis TaxID=99883 RepID=Q4SFC6_TETNG|nr:unnamed protein product [Tetraodon nigroviridis]